ncbi:MAG TPA: protein kinase [Solirubrobacteraceae bacterium]|nr:protein kinase [Solirubrobacteraceae bacterium]
MPHAPDLSGCALDERYELHALIGEGAFGRVYEGRDRRLDRPVAVKVIKPWWAEDPEWVAIFEREAQLLARVSDPGIVQIFDVGHAPEGVYYVSELVDGEDLAARLRRGPLRPWDACGVAVQLCRALARAHAQRIVHRDVKPANILLSRDGQVKVGDFGVARLAEGSTGGTASMVGTPRYMAPEQGRGLPTTPATDIYSVGVVLYEMLSGRPPFSGETVVELALRHLQDPPPPLSARLPGALVQITARALAKDPAERYRNGAEMAEALVQAGRQSESGRRAGVAPARARTGSHTPAREGLGTGVKLAGTSARGSRMPPPIPRVPVAGLPPVRPTDGLPPRRNHAVDLAEPVGSAGSAGSVGVAGSAGLAGPAARPDETRPAPVMSRRHNVNPPARRRAAAALGIVLLLLAGMVAADVLLAPPARTRVPGLTGLRRAAVTSAARRAHLSIRWGHRYASAAAGVAVGQHPGAGALVDDGTRVAVVLSRGPAPVRLPSVDHESLADAQRSLTSLGLRTVVHPVPAPGVAPGTVTGQSPAGGGTVPAKSTVALSVAETPQWRALSRFGGRSSGVLHITGERWRIVYSMGFQGTCTWILFCSGPTARVIDTATGQTVRGFGLADGNGQSETFGTGPGSYEILVTPGGDAATWSIEVEDYF